MTNPHARRLLRRVGGRGRGRDRAGRGLIPFGPTAGEPLHGAATNGVVSRSVRDSAAMLDVLAGPDATVPYAPAMPAGRFLDEVGRDPGRLRIGFHTASAINSSPHPDAVAAVTEAAGLLESLGHDVEPVAAPYDDAALARDFLSIWFVHAAYEVADIRRRTGAGDEGFELDTLVMAALGRTINSVEHCAALERRHEHVRGLATFHQSYDLLLTRPSPSRRRASGSSTRRARCTPSRACCSARGRPGCCRVWAPSTR
jgi:Asp-tRNA(Asn)/Glu-tRNA(Gln) amidotransferase A subunit family amidase